MDIIYLIIKEGINRHDIFGAYTGYDEAAARAKELADTDIDAYHEYVVQPVVVNEPCVMGRWSLVMGHTADEPAPCARFRKATGNTR